MYVLHTWMVLQTSTWWTTLFLLEERVLDLDLPTPRMVPASVAADHARSLLLSRQAS